MFMKTKTYYRTIGAQMVKLLITIDSVEIFTRFRGNWVTTSIDHIEYMVMNTPLESRLLDGSFIKMLRKDL